MKVNWKVSLSCLVTFSRIGREGGNFRFFSSFSTPNKLKRETTSSHQHSLHKSYGVVPKEPQRIKLQSSPPPPTSRRLSFADLEISPALLPVLKTIKIENPSPIQQEVIPLILSGESCFVQAPTGQGKTLAFLLPILTSFLENTSSQSSDSIDTLFILPSAELALQLYHHTHSILAEVPPSSLPSPLSTLCFLAISNSEKETVEEQQKRLLRDKPKFVFGTAKQILALFFPSVVKRRHPGTREERRRAREKEEREKIKQERAKKNAAVQTESKVEDTEKIQVEQEREAEMSEIIDDDNEIVPSPRIQYLYSRVHAPDPAPLPITPCTELIMNLNSLVIDEIDTQLRVPPRYAHTSKFSRYYYYPPPCMALLRALRYTVNGFQLIGVSATINAQVRAAVKANGWKDISINMIRAGETEDSTRKLPIVAFTAEKPKNSTKSEEVVISPNEGKGLSGINHLDVPTSISHYYCIAPTYRQIVDGTWLTTEAIEQKLLEKQSSLLESNQLITSTAPYLTPEKQVKQLIIEESKKRLVKRDIMDKFRLLAFLYSYFNLNNRIHESTPLVFIDESLTMENALACLNLVGLRGKPLDEQVKTSPAKYAKFVSEAQSQINDCILLTPSLCRGLDFPKLTHLFLLLPFPVDSHIYLHVAGRVGRLGQGKGTVVSLVYEEEVWGINRIGERLPVTMNELSVDLVMETETKKELEREKQEMNKSSGIGTREAITFNDIK